MAIQATGRATFTKVEDYSIVFNLNDVRCDVLNFDNIKAMETASFGARFFNNGEACSVAKADITCYDSNGNVLGSPIEVSDTSEAIVDGGNLYLSGNCQYIVCCIYNGGRMVCSSTIAVVKNGESVSVKSVTYKVINNVDANTALNWDRVVAQANYPTNNPDKGKYMYVMTIVTYTDGSVTNSVSTSYTPTDGIGVTTSTTVTYARTSNNVQPSSFLLTSVPTDLQLGEYLWSKTVVTYKGVNTETTTSIAVSRVGKDGAVGYSLHMLYSNVENPDKSQISTSMQAGYDYIYVYSDQSTMDDPSKGVGQKFKKIKGTDGKNARRTAVVSVTSENGTVFNDSYAGVFLKCKVMIDGKDMGGKIPRGNFMWTKNWQVVNEDNAYRFRTASSSDSLDLFKCSVKIPKRLIEPIELTTIRVEGNNLIFRASEDITGKKLYPCWKRHYTVGGYSRIRRNAWGFHDLYHSQGYVERTALGFISLGNNIYSVDMSRLVDFVQDKNIALHNQMKNTVLKHGTHRYLVKKGTDGKYRAWGRYGVMLANDDKSKGDFMPISTPAKCKIYIETDSDTATTGTAYLSV